MRTTVIPYILYLGALLFALPAAAQNCGCVDAGNCPEAIGSVVDFNVCYDFTDAFNDDLSDPAQGVCGVNLSFTHDYIWDLELSLISPAGQEVMLVGPDTMGSGGTLFTSWDVQFVPCTETAQPDAGFSATWTNTQAWPVIGAIGGSYYPVEGACLDDFDTGPANGQWCIRVNNNSFTGGTLLDFELILCDQSGIFCCEADGGDLIDNLTACQGDASLLLDLTPEYTDAAPDVALYGYTYLIGEQGGLLLDTAYTPDLSLYPPGDYEVCGLSFDLNEADQIPEANGVLTLQEIKDDLNGLNPSFCASLSDNCYPVTILSPLPITDLADTICVEETYVIGDSVFTASGNYDVYFSSQFGCDSLVNLSLTVLPIDTAFIVQTICEGETLVVGDSTFTLTGNYEVYLEGASRCDSTYLVDLTVLSPFIEDIDTTICEGESFIVGNESYSTTGIYVDTLNSLVTGCDSIVNLNLEVISVNAEVAFPDNITCQSSSVTLDGTNSSNEAGTVYEWTVISGQISDLLPPANQPTAEVTGAGIFQLKVSRFACVDSVAVNVFDLSGDSPIAEAGLDTMLTCSQNVVQLDGTNSEQDDSYIYYWTTEDGLIDPATETSLTPYVSGAPAFYYLNVEDTETGCVGIDSVFVDLDNDLPFVNAGNDTLFNCLVNSIALEGNYIDGSYTYVWTDANGSFLAENELGQAIVSEVGTYYYTITETATGCSSTDEVEVTENLNIPDLSVLPADELTCQENLITLTAEVTDISDFSIEWSGTGLNSGQNTLTPTVNAPGWYYVSVTDNSSFCLAIDSVLVMAASDLPNADAGPAEVYLTCVEPTWELGNPTTTSVGADFSQSWYLNNGFVSSDFPYEVSEGGLYVLEVVNNVTGCLRHDTIEVIKNLLQPIAYAGEDAELNCEVTSIILDGEELSPLPDDDDLFIEYQWYDENNELIQSGEDSLLVVNPGLYTLVLFETITSCADTATVEIVQDPTVPIAEAGAAMFLDCATGTTTLDGTGSALGDFTYTWTSSVTADINPSDGLTPTVNAVGTYFLEVSSNTDNCSAIDEVQVSLDTAACLPIAVLNPGFEVYADGENGIIDCNTEHQAFVEGIGYFLDTISAQGSTPPGPNITYTWIAENGFVTDESNTTFPIVTEGTYILQVTNTLLNISAFDTLSVINIIDFPNADAGENTALTCPDLASGYLLDGTNSDQGANYTYLWSSLDGGDFGDSDVSVLNPVIYAPGTYELTVTDNSNGCTSISPVLISPIGEFPTPCLINEVQMECIDAFVTIGDSCSVDNPGYTYTWSVIENGEIIGVDDLPFINVSTDTSQVSALFELVVTNPINQCFSVDTIEVFTAVNCYPDCVVDLSPPSITCLEESVLLNATGSSEGDIYAYLWENIGGNGGFCGGENTLTPCVDTEGLYRLTVTNTETGFACQSALVFVNENNSPPDVSIDEDSNLSFTCIADLVTISASSSDTDTYAFSWSSENACILTDATQPEIEVNCIGVYELMVTDLETGCVNTMDVNVDFDTIPPANVVVSPDNALIGCINPQVVLSGSGSSQGNYSWYRNGALVVGENNLTYLADEAGEYCLVVTDINNGCTNTNCVTVEEDDDAVFADAGENAFLTCSGGPAILTGTAPVGPEFTYQWSTNAGDGCFSPPTGSLTINADCPGTYTLTVIDLTTGCEGVSTVQVIDNTTPPLVNIGSDLELDCNNLSVEIDGTASDLSSDFIYNWVGPSFVSTDDPRVVVANAPGTYSLLVYNELTDCFAVDEVEITLSADLPFVDAGADTLYLTCSETQLELDGSNSSQNDSLSYLWTAQNGVGILTDPTDFFVTINETGNYIFSVTNDSTNCVNTDTLRVLKDTISPLVLLEIDNGAELNCLVDTISLSANLSQPTATLDFIWSTSNGSIISPFSEPEIFVNEPGAYDVFITNTLNGCSADSTVVVTADFVEPFINIADPDMLTCVLDEVDLDAIASQENSLFSWSSPDGFLIQNAETPTPTVFEAGMYELQLISIDNGCDNQATVVVQENVTPPDAVAMVDGTLDCVTNSVVLSGVGSSAGTKFTYQWTGTAAVESPNSLITNAFAEGEYILTVTDIDNGCEATAEATVVASGFPITEILTSVQTPTCLDDASGLIQVDSVVGGNAPYFFSFEGGAFSEYDYRNYLTAGSYTLAVEDADGCFYETTVTVEENPELLIELGPNIEIELGESTELSVQINLAPDLIDTIIWQPLPDENCPGCPEQTITPTESMNLSVLVRDTFGCVADDNILLYVIGGEESPVFVPNVFSPNGTNNNTIVPFAKTDVEVIKLFQIFDRWGNLVWQKENFMPGDPAAAWDGRHKEQIMNSQVLVWRMEYLLHSSGTSEVKWGDITLMK